MTLEADILAAFPAEVRLPARLVAATVAIVTTTGLLTAAVMEGGYSPVWQWLA